jgi:hypothetical protein
MMTDSTREILWNQFGASIDMLKNAVDTCPEALWDNKSEFWYLAYHTIFWLDYYLAENPNEFLPPPPFTLSETDPAGLMPERTYSKAELLDYLVYARKKCHDRIAGLTDEKALARFANNRRDYSVLEILLYNMRHVQHGAAQLNILLRQGGEVPPGWVSQAEMSQKYE